MPTCSMCAVCKALSRTGSLDDDCLHDRLSHTVQTCASTRHGTLLGSDVAEHASHATQRLVALRLGDELQRQRCAGQGRTPAVAVILSVASAGRCAVIQRGPCAAAGCLADLTVRFLCRPAARLLLITILKVCRHLMKAGSVWLGRRRQGLKHTLLRGGGCQQHGSCTGIKGQAAGQGLQQCTGAGRRQQHGHRRAAAASHLQGTPTLLSYSGQLAVPPLAVVQPSAKCKCGRPKILYDSVCAPILPSGGSPSDKTQ